MEMSNRQSVLQLWTQALWLSHMHVYMKTTLGLVDVLWIGGDGFISEDSFFWNILYARLDIFQFFLRNSVLKVMAGLELTLAQFRSGQEFHHVS